MAQNKEYLLFSLTLTFTYMMCDIIFLYVYKCKDYKLYILHHIAVVICIEIIFTTKNVYLLNMFPLIAMLSEITNIPQQLIYITLHYKYVNLHKLVVNFFIPFYFTVRVLFITDIVNTFQNISKERLEIEVLAICFIGFTFVPVSYTWWKKFKKDIFLARCNCFEKCKEDILEISDSRTKHCVGEPVTIQNFDHYHFVYTKRNNNKSRHMSRNYYNWLYTYVPTGLGFNYNNAIYCMKDGTIKWQWEEVKELYSYPIVENMAKEFLNLGDCIHKEFELLRDYVQNIYK